MRITGEVVTQFRRYMKYCCHLSVLVILFGMGQENVEGNEVGKRDALWRRPERDGVNCLYLQLRSLGCKKTYKEIVGAVPANGEQASLAELAQAAKQVGIELVPARLTMVELTSLRSPTVILFEEAERGSGRYHLLLGFSESDALLVDGTFMTRTKMSVDQFRRGWTGLALVQPARSAWPERWLGAMVGGLAAAGVAAIMGRCRAFGRRWLGMRS